MKKKTVLVVTEKCAIIGCCYLEPGELDGLARRGAVTACAWLFTRAKLGGQPCPAQAAQSCLEFRRGERERG